MRGDGKDGSNRIHGMMVSSQQVIKEQEQKEEVNGNTDQSNGKKVPVLTISLRPGEELRFIHVCVCVHPYMYCTQVSNTCWCHVSVTVVVLETLNSALQESLSSNGKVRSFKPTKQILFRCSLNIMIPM